MLAGVAGVDHPEGFSMMVRGMGGGQSLGPRSGLISSKCRLSSVVVTFLQMLSVQCSRLIVDSFGVVLDVVVI
jgi:hypothetical protein